MSMSQEEIEALMNGAEGFGDDDTTEATQSDEEAGQSDEIPEVEEEIPNEEEEDSSEDNFDDILAGIDGITDDDSSDENFDDILAGIDGITDDDSSMGKKEEDTSSKSSSNIEELIEQNKYPLPVEKEHKVVNQLSEVAEDSEQKASQIFDVLSFILDENNDISNFNKRNTEFLAKQIEMLEALSNKFPNIELFKENLEDAKSLSETAQEIGNKVDTENMKIFEAMELMQYHDINRQKIERVMAVIRKLNDYLNGIFEDESNKPEVQIAKHISGDSSEIVEADDLEALITEFANKD
eukprot:Anaeramoba_ignava/a481217_16.p1 GENE.a481217_16~~a481217_16.p1  ORF type:complete len:296 (+),score=56.59 a481217_16:378-1265(+)